ncbi:hypothetical protein Tph_c20840 [Thermacetogenium phaeum DSM 12270]|uniref:Uncharacterized protein n=1 Tax=Thermacetogenium phaeum (strain ATCC BAA-254 / DSM 26808 / PB) TaxID=1089553 RepID=K4LHE5_THEPS|nr:hypothetical protein [Thermacetogenium phaeum]AFV12278.1 hypothetical protein Tph_c20840 [Thermacetogenium phaeum DSM 12270]
MNDSSVVDFVVAYLERVGAVVEQPGYALAEVLLPESLVPVFGREEMLLAFDYEVAQETPGSIFITHGSSLLDTIVRLAADYGKQTVLYWSGELPSAPRSLEQKIHDQIDYLQCRPPRLDTHWVAENIFYGFYFRGIFRSFEKTEEILPVIVDGYQAIATPGFEKQVNSLFFQEQPDYRVASAPLSPLSCLYQVACREVKKLVLEKAVPLCKEAAKLQEKELAKVCGYYESTEAEIRRKLRTTTDPVRKERLEKQLAATIEDRRRRIDDTRGRYQVDIDLRLDHLVAYHLPCVFARVKIQHKKKILEQILVYNPVTEEVDPPPCPICGQAARCLIPDRDGRFTCPDCH